MHPAQFFVFLIFTALVFLGILFPYPGGLGTIGFVFIAIPLLDYLIGEDKRNPDPHEEAQWKSSSSWAPALYLYAFTHFFVLLLAGHKVHNGSSWSLTLLLSVVVGLYTGGLGITVAHELCHKKEFLPRITADFLLSSVWYQHFSVEHVRGHHLMVATPDDPASARRNENAYAFVLRSIRGSFLHALSLDKKKVFAGVMMSFLLSAIAAFFGTKVLVFFLLQAVVAFVLLELVNYIEHYGLERKQLPNGRYEKVLPKHSWNSSHKFSNLLLFNLQRHSDHHALAHLPYTVLKHHEEAPQLPTGYPGMILIALVPGLWFRVMNPRVEKA